MSGRNKRYRDFDNAMGLSFGIIDIMLFLALIAAFVVVTTLVFLVWTFVRYRKQKVLWIALTVCLAAIVAGVILYKLTSIAAFLALLPIAILGLVIVCLVTWLKESTTLLPENVNIIDRVLHTSWWNLDDKPLEKEPEQLAA